MFGNLDNANWCAGQMEREREDGAGTKHQFTHDASLQRLSIRKG